MRSGQVAALQQLQSARKLELILRIVGVPIGYAVSYWCQPQVLRAKCSLGQYFGYFFDIITSKDTGPTAIFVTLVADALFWALGRWIVHHTELLTAPILAGDEQPPKKNATQVCETHKEDDTVTNQEAEITENRGVEEDNSPRFGTKEILVFVFIFVFLLYMFMFMVMR